MNGNTANSHEYASAAAHVNRSSSVTWSQTRLAKATTPTVWNTVRRSLIRAMTGIVGKSREGGRSMGNGPTPAATLFEDEVVLPRARRTFRADRGRRVRVPHG